MKLSPDAVGRIDDYADDTLAELRAWARIAMSAGIPPGGTITLEEHNARMALRDRPLTQSPLMRHHSSGNSHQLGELL